MRSSRSARCLIQARAASEDRAVLAVLLLLQGINDGVGRGRGGAGRESSRGPATAVKLAQTASKATKGAQRGRLMPVFAWGATKGGTGHRKPRGAARAKGGRDPQESLGPIRKGPNQKGKSKPSSEVRSEVRARASRGLGGRSISRRRRLRESRPFPREGKAGSPKIHPNYPMIRNSRPSKSPHVAGN